MSYFNTDPKDVKAHKRHSCSWCGEKIEVGETYKRWSCIGDDGPCAIKMHQECKMAERRFAELEAGGYEYDLYSFTRGCVCESGDSGHGTYPHCIVLPSLPNVELTGPQETEHGK